jgi:hypothetical protein
VRIVHSARHHTNRIRVLAEFTRPGSEDIWTVNMFIQRVRLAGVGHKEELVVSKETRVGLNTVGWAIQTSFLPSLFPHLSDSISNVMRADLFVVLEFQELVPTMSRHVDKDV